jgi:FMN phosphatase YigB (HAD superfamily)
MREAALFDLDGTLCDTSTIEHLTRGPDKNYAAFHAASAGCPPRVDVHAALSDARERGLAIVLWTGREFLWRDLTLDWLDGHGIAHDGLYMRLAADYRPATKVKSELLRDIAADGFAVVEAWEDDAAIVELLREAKVPVVNVIA